LTKYQEYAIIKAQKEKENSNMEILLIVIVAAFFLLILCASSTASRGSERRYGYVSLPDGKTTEGWVEKYEPESSGMASIRINGKTYYTHCSKITLIKK
jgi:hypothetical protein